MTAAVQVPVLTVTSMGKGFKQSVNPLTKFLDVFLSAAAGNLLAFGPDGGLVLLIAAATATVAGLLPATGGVSGAILMTDANGNPYWNNVMNGPIAAWPAQGLI